VKQITLYNSLANKKVVFEPQQQGSATIYSCGPTVYDQVHVGNLRAFISADLVQRVLRKVGGLSVKWVMNITDIDDKMIERARQHYPGKEPMEALHSLAQTYTQQFRDDITAVGIQLDDLATISVATEHIPEMQTLITQLLDSKIAYIADGSIYFSIKRYEETGQKYGQLVDVSYDAQTRIDDQDQKQGAGDFALWKAAKPDEPSWDFEVAGQNLPGRPGWHIECTAMSTTYLGQHFDIHTGGIDLKFPHHENEIAQNGGSLASIWLHNEHLHTSGDKMSKSLGNFTTLTEIENPITYRLLVMSSHYRSQMDFSSAGLEQASLRHKALREWVSRVVNNKSVDNEKLIADLRERFDAALADDLNTPEAMAVIAEASASTVFSPSMHEFIQYIDACLGLQLGRDQTDLRNDESVIQLLDSREAVRRAKDFERSDKIRESLHKLGVGVEDTQSGQVIWQMAD